MKDDKYDFFISHASEDKEGFVKALAEELEKSGYKIWYDEFTLKIGDSLVDSIQDGIKKAYYGLIILSKNFFRKPWTKKELNALISKEIRIEENILLPIWHDVSYEDVYDFSPFLADRLAISTNKKSIGEIVQSIQAKTGTTITTAEMLKSKIEEFSNYNPDKRKKEAIDIVNKIDRIFLFQEAYYNYYMDDSNTGGPNNWDDNFIELKQLEFKKEYGIPNTVWTNPEPFAKTDISKAKKMAIRWINKKLSESECEDFYSLLDDWLDTDIFYILYGFPHGTVKIKDAYPIALEGILKIGCRKRT